MFSIHNATVVVNQKTIIRNLSLSIVPGSIQVLMGPNGSGKSSLAYALLGHPSYEMKGEVLLDGHDLLSLPVEKRARAGLFLVSQYPQEVPGVQVATFLKEAYRSLVDEAITATDFNQKLLEALVAVKLDPSFAYRSLHEGFSGGEKKRLEIAQLLLLRPKVAILDEIDSGLDVDALQFVVEAIQTARKQNPEMGILLITHYQKIIDTLRPDGTHILKDGKIVASGDHTLAQLINQRGYDALPL